MDFIAAYHTDVGLTKKTNQDSLAIKIVETDSGQAAFGIVCDGMGGLAKGELASKEVIFAFADWFDKTFMSGIKRGGYDTSKINEEWESIIQSQNKKLGQYGKNKNLQLGTTISAILLYKGRYYIVHVGDSRVYQITGNNIYLLTNDQTFIAREIAAGRMTVEQSKRDPRRSVLLQCVGASEVVNPEYSTGIVMPGTTYVICSDGFRHQINEEEMISKIGPKNTSDEKSMKDGCVYLTEIIKARRETDNISVALIKTA